MDSYGLIVGIGLLATVTLCAFLLGLKANRGVNAFRQEKHRSFLGRLKR